MLAIEKLENKAKQILEKLDTSTEINIAEEKLLLYEAGEKSKLKLF